MSFVPLHAGERDTDQVLRCLLCFPASAARGARPARHVHDFEYWVFFSSPDKENTPAITSQEIFIQYAIKTTRPRASLCAILLSTPPSLSLPHKSRLVLLACAAAPVPPLAGYETPPTMAPSS